MGEIKAELNAELQTHIAVSYTHLDVYKRQGVIVGIVRIKAADAVLCKRLTGGNKAVVIGGQRNAVFRKQTAVDQKARCV